MMPIAATAPAEPAEIGAQGLLADLAAADAADGWDPDAGLPHPSGGYTLRTWEQLETAAGTARSAMLNFFARDASGARLAHRGDGPSSLQWRWEVGQAPQVSYQEWRVHGTLHRGEGPALVSTDVGDTTTVDLEYAWRGHLVERFRERGTLVSPAGARLCDLLAAGVDASQAVGWLLVESEQVERTFDARQVAATPELTPDWVEQARAIARADLAAMIATGLDVDVALSLTRAGVSDVATLAAVAAGELPISWAIAGAQR